MPLPPITRFNAVDTKASPTNNNNGLYAPELTQAQVNAIPEQTKHNGGIWYNNTVNQLEAQVNGATITLAAGNGNVSGPANAVDNNIAVFDGTSGKKIKDSKVNIGQLKLPQNLFSNANEINAVGDFIRFPDDIGLIFVDGLMPIEFITQGSGIKTQVCSLFTGELPGNSTTESALVEIQSDIGALLLSRMDTTKRTDLIMKSGSDGTNGMMLFNTDNGGAFNGYDGTNWREFALFNTNGTLNVATPTSSTNAATKAYVDSSVGATSLTLTGNVTGSGLLSSPIVTTLNMTLDQISPPGANLNLNNKNIINLLDPTTAQQAATKNYVDTRTITLSGAVTGSGALGTTIATTLTPITTSQITNFNSAVTAFRLDQFAIPTANINLNNQKIINLATPTASTDGATKGYVDSVGAAKFIIQTANALLPNAQALEALTTGLLKNATTTGILTIGVAGTDYYSPGFPTTLRETATNFFIGNSTGINISSGANNTGLGINVLSLLTNGDGNTSLGFQSLQNNVIGSFNSAYGFRALRSNNANQNCAFGAEALTTNSSGTDNCTFGYRSLRANLLGSSNCAFGTSALEQNVGNFNSAFGAQALASTTGNVNSAFGYQALINNITGSGNVGIGFNAGVLHDTYNTCILIGNSSDTNANNLTNAIAIGYQALVGASNCMVLGGTGANEVSVGIGITTPHAPLQFSNATVNRKIVLFEGTNNDHQFYGLGINSSVFRFQISNTTSNYIFYAASSTSTSNELMRLGGDGNLLVGGTSVSARIVATGGVVDVNNETSCIRAVSSTDATKIELQRTGGSGRLWELRSLSTGAFDITDRTGSATRLSIDSTGRVGIGTTPNELLTVNTSTPEKITAGSWAGISDARVKDIVGDYEHGLAEIIQIQTRKFKYNDRSGYPESEKAKINIGVIAQEIEDIFPECIIEKVQRGDISDMRVYDGTALTYALINAVKELNNEITNLKKQINN